MPRVSTGKTLRSLGLPLLLAALAAPGARAGESGFDEAAEPSSPSLDAGIDAMPAMSLEAVPPLANPLLAPTWTPSAAAALSGAGHILSQASLAPAAAGLVQARPALRGKIAARSPRAELAGAARSAAALVRASPSMALEIRAARAGFDTSDILSLSQVLEIARQPIPGMALRVADGTGRIGSIRVLDGLPGARPLLKLSHGESTYAAKFHTDEKIAGHEAAVLDEITRAADRDGIAEALPGFRVQRAAPLKLLFANDKGVLLPVVLSEWITARPLSDILDVRDPKAVDPQKVHALYERLADIERGDFWKGLSWLQETGFALIDWQPNNVMVSFPNMVITIFDFETAVRRPADPSDGWNHTRFNRAGRIWQRALRKWRDELKEKLSFFHK